MKAFVLLSIMILSPAALADDAADARWIKLKMLAANDDSNPQAVRDAITAGDAAIKKVGTDTVHDICAHRPDYDFDPEKFARTIEAWIAKEKTIRIEYLAKIDTELSSAQKTTLDEKVRKIPEPTVVRTNVAENIRNGTIDLKDALDRTCQGDKS